MIWLIIYLVGLIPFFGIVWMGINSLEKTKKFSKDVIKKYSWAAYIVIGVFWPLFVLFLLLAIPYKVYKMIKK